MNVSTRTSVSASANYGRANFTADKTNQRSKPGQFMRWLLMLCMFVSVGTQMQAQTLANYTFSTNTNASLEDMSSATFLISGNYDTQATPVTDIGFPFLFMGNVYTQFSANSNGQMRLGGTQISGGSTGLTAGAAILGAFGGDNEVNGGISYRVVGTAPNRKLVVEFNQFYVYYTPNLTNAGNMQIWLTEGTNRVDYVYGEIYNASGSSQTRNIFISSSNTATTAGSITINAAPTAPTFAVGSTLASNTIAAGSGVATGSPLINNIGSSAQGSRRIFSWVPTNLSIAGPSSLSFANIGLTTMTLNWVASSPQTNVLGYAVFASSDGGTTYNPVAAVSGSATTTVDVTGLTPNTTYLWQVYAFSEGNLSATYADGVQGTNTCAMSGTYSIGPSGTYTTLSGASGALAALASQGAAGPVIFELATDYVSTGETFPITLPNVPCMDGTNTVTIRPASGASSLSIAAGSGATSPAIDFSGGRYYIIDGRAGGTGAPVLTISNASNNPAIRFVNDASNNILRYTTVTAANTNTSSGIILFSTTTGTTGNDNNTITNNDINGAGVAANLIYSSGTSSATNSGNTISSNNLRDQFVAGSATSGIYVSSSSTDWTITGNSLYQTASRTYTTSNTHYGIYVGTGNNHVITNNFIGGSSASAGGSAYTMNGTVSNVFVGIYSTGSSTTANTITGNSITNISFTSASTTSSLPGVFAGIYLSSGIASISSNTISSIAINSSANGGVSVGIGSASSTTGTIAISNNTISGITIAGTTTAFGSSFTGIWNSGSGTTLQITGNTVGSTSTANSIYFSSATTGSSGGVLMGIYNSGSATTPTIYNNTVANLTTNYSPSSAFTSPVIRGIFSNSGAITISTNTVRDLTANANTTGTGAGAGVIGISVTAGASQLISNTVYSLTNNHATSANYVTGIYWGGSSSGAITRNLVYSLNTPSTIALVNGIQLNTGVTASNNMIRLGIDASGASRTTATNFNGFYVTAAANVYHNTVYIGGTGVTTSPAIASYAYNSTVTSGTRSVLNNIFVNARSSASAGAKHYAIKLNGLTGLTINYNVYYAPGSFTGVIGTNGTTDYTTLAAWQGYTTQDANSKNVDVCLNNPTAGTPNLHLTDCSGAGNPADGAGVLTSVTDDFDGETRSLFTPIDIGADAGNYGLTGVNVGLSTLVSPAAPTGCYTNAESVVVTLNNYGVSTIDFSVNPVTINVTTNTGYSSTLILNTGTLAVGSQNVTMPNTIDMTLGGTYTFNGSATTSGDVNTANDAFPTVSYVYKALSGTYTVGATGNYATLYAAVDAYNTAICLNGPVTFSLIDANYSTAETFPISINGHPMASSVNTLTIKPASGVSAVITGSNASALLKLNGADYVTIDGSNNGSNSRDLTFNNTSTTAGATGIWVSAVSSSNGATNDVVKNCNVIGAAGSSTVYGITVAGTSTTGAAAASNSNVTISNNSISKANTGIYVNGTSSTGVHAGLTLNGNSIGSAVTADQISSKGIYLAQVTGATISNNTVFNLIGTAANPTGIDVSTGVVNSTFSKNIIRNIKYTGTSGYGGKGININTGTATSNLTFSNNMVSGILGDGWNNFLGDAIVGIRVGATANSTVTTGGINFYHNSVNLGDGSFTGSESGTLSAAIYFSSTTSNIDLRNNIFSTNLVNSNASTAKTYAIASAASTSPFTTIDYNDYWVSGAQGVLGLTTAGDQVNLAAIQSGFGGNANSKNLQPVYTSATDLHLTPALNSALDDKGTNVSVTTDIDGDTRSASTPDMGVDEFTAPEVQDVRLSALVAPGNSGCYSATEAVTVTVLNNTNFPLDLSVNPVTVTVTATGGYSSSTVLNSGIIAALGTQNVTMPATIDLTVAGTYTFNGSATVVGDINTANDALTATNIVSAPVSIGAATASPESYCQTGGTPTLTIASAAGGTIQWQESTVSATGPWTDVGTNSLTYTPSTAITATSYYRAVVSCAASSTSVNSNVVTVNLYAPAITGTTPGTRCGPGTVTLGATANAGSTITWYGSASGGTPLATGTSFTTPSISANTSYWVEASTGSAPINVGPVSPTAQGGTIGTQTVAWNVNFTTLASTTLSSVDIYPVASGQSGVIELRQGSTTSGTLIATVNYTTTVSGGATAQTIPLNFVIGTPGSYNLYTSTLPSSGITRNTSGQTYPVTSAVANITGNGFDNTYWMGMYKWVFGSGCASARQEVVATVTTPPTVTASATSTTICNGQSTTLSATSSNDPSYTYTWTPGPLTGANQTVSPTANTTYIVNAVDNTAGPNAGCTASATVAITVNPTPTSVTANASTDVVCVGGTVNLTSSANSGENVSVNYTQGFESGIPGSWALINAGSGNIWASATSPSGGTHGGTGVAQYIYNTDFDADTWMITEGFTIPANVTATLSFWENTSSSFPEKLKVTVGTNQTIAGQTTTLVDYGSHGLGAYTLRTITFTPTTTGTYYFGFHAYSIADQFYINIDDLSLTYAASVPASFAWTSSPAGFTSTDQNPTGVAPTVNTTYTVTASNSFGCSATASKSVTISDLAVSASATDASCNGTTTGSVTATATGGTTPYEFSLNGTTWQSSNTFNGLAAGTYTVQVRDANTVQCIVSASPVTVNEPTAIVVSIGGSTDPVCYNSADGTISASATGGTGTLTYTIAGPTVNTTGASTGNFTGLTGGSYTITATDANNCSAISTTVVLNAPAAPSVTASNNGPVCAGSDATLTATSGYASYAWTGPGTINNANTESATAVTPTDGAVYTVTITDANGCQNTATTTVSVTENAAVSVSIAVSPSTEICSNAEVTFTATPVNGGTTPTYQWYVNSVAQSGETNSTFVTSTIADQDVVYVEMTSSIGCTTGSPATSNSITMTVTGLIFADASIAASSETVCDGTSVTLTGSGNGAGSSPTYDFYVNNNLVQSGASATYTYVPTNGDEAYVVITSSFDCAIGSPATSSSVVITVNPIPAAPTVSLSGSTTFCDGGSVTLTSDYVGGNLWSPNGETTDAITVSVSGTYSVTQTQLGCTSAASTPVVVTVNANPTATVTGASNLCAGTTQTLSAATSTAGSGTITSYQWTLNGTTALGTLATQDITVAGSYTVTVTNSNGCSTTSAAFVVTEVAAPTVSVDASCTTLAPGGTATLTATATSLPVTYAWTLNGGSTLSTSNPYVTAVNAAGTYAVTVTNSNGCTATASVVVNNLSGPLAAGTYTIPATCNGFPTIASAVNYLNVNGVTGTGDVVISVTGGYSETAPPTGFALTATGTATNQIKFVKSGAGAVTVNAGVGTNTPGSATIDAMFKIIGGDYITIDGFTFTDGNTTNPATMEAGVALLKASATNGAQYNTISNNSFTMQRVNNATASGARADGAVGVAIYNTTNAASAAVTVTAASGANSYNKVYGNSITGGNTGVALIGYAAASPFTLADFGNDVGGTSGTTGNTIVNFGGGATTNPAVGVRTLAQYDLNVSYNTINNNNGSGVNHATTLRGIYLNTATSASETVNNNTITVSSGATTSQLTAIENVAGGTAASNTVSINNNTVTTNYSTATSGNTYGIYNSASAANLNINGNTITVNTAATSGSDYLIYQSGSVATTTNINNNSTSITLSATSTSATTRAIFSTGSASTNALSISNNNFNAMVHSGSTGGTGETDAIYNNAAALTSVISGNNFNNLQLKTTGTIYLLYNNYTAPANGSKTVQNNTIVTGLARTIATASSSFYVYYDNASSPSTVSHVISGNNFSNITNNATGSSTFYGFYSTDYSGNPSLSFYNNTLSNVTFTGTGSFYGMYLGGFAGTAGTPNEVYGNTVSGINSSSTSTSQYGLAVTSAGLYVNVYNNTIQNITVTAAGSQFAGLYATGTTNLNKFYNNTITGITSTNTGAIVGLLVTSGTQMDIYENKVNSFTGGGNVWGIYVSGGTLINVYNHKTIGANNYSVYGLSSSGAANVVEGIRVAGGTTVNAYRNNVYNLSNSSSSTTATNSFVNGVSVTSGTTVNVYNNTIGNLTAPAVSYLDAIRGISITSTSGTANVSFNTVYLNATSTGATFGTSGVYAGTGGSTLNLRSNIIANASTAMGSGVVAAYRRSSNDLVTYGSLSNRNLFYAGTPGANNVIYTDGTNSDQTLTDYKTRVTPKDIDSKTENPPFVSTTGSDATYLHINTTVETQIESGGVNVAGITDDIDGDVRQGNSGYAGTSTLGPDMGADEFDGIAPACSGAVGGTASPATASVCASNTASTFTVGGASSGAGIAYQWMVSTTTGGPYTNVTGGSGANTVSYTTPANLAAGTYYYVLNVACTVGEGSNANSTEIAFTVKPVPTASASSNSPVCSGTTLNLTGTTDVGTTYAWTGPNSFTSTSQNPSISNATLATSGTYSFTATFNGCTSAAGTVDVTINPAPTSLTVSATSTLVCEGSTVTLSSTGGVVETSRTAVPIGTATGANSSSGYPAPYSVYYGGQKMQTLMRASELTAAGFVAGDNIGGIGFNVNSFGSNWGSTLTELQNFRVKVKMVDPGTINVMSSTFVTGMTEVVAPASFVPTVGTTNVHNFSTSIPWNGTDNLVIETNFSNNISGTTSDAVIQPYTSTSYVSTAVYRGDNVSASSVDAQTTASSSQTFSNRPDFRLYKVTTASPTITWTASPSGPTAGMPVNTGASISVTPTVSTQYSAVADYNGCSTAPSNVISLVVNPAPAGNMTNGTVAVCQGAATPSITFTGTTGTAPYTFSYTINGGTTQTVTTGSGTNPQSVTITVPTGTPGTFTYALTNVADIYCSSAVTGSQYEVTVNATPTVSFTGLPATVCANSGTYTLNGTPSGGTFSGPGISGNVFNPAAAGVGGPYTITYSYTNGSGCSASATQTVTVNAAPTVSFTGLAANYCTVDAAVTLTGSPAGGTFSGTGISGNTFDPAVAGAGTFTITYSYTNGSGCTATSTQEVTVSVCATDITLNLNAFLEGMYVGGGTMTTPLYDLGIETDPTASDYITVNLWSAGSLSNSTPDYTQTVILHNDGTASVTFPSAVSGNSYYIAIKHRNSIETWSAAPVAFTSTTSYSFTSGLSQAYDDGVNAPMADMGGGVYALYGGDVNQDGTVDLNDLIQADNDASNYEFGYNATDVTGDGATDLSDMLIIENNSNLYLFFARPY